MNIFLVNELEFNTNTHTSISLLGPGKKSIHHHRGTPPFSVFVARPRGHRAKKAMVYTNFLGKTREKGVHHRPGKKGIHHRASDPEKEKKEGLHGGGVHLFLPCVDLASLCGKLGNSQRGGGAKRIVRFGGGGGGGNVP